MVKKLESAFHNIQVSATQKGVDLHKSFYIELENYSRHKKVRRLPSEQLGQVIEGIGEITIVEYGAKLGGGHVRDVLTRLCTDPFSDCFDAASQVLEAGPNIAILAENLKKPTGGTHSGSSGAV